MSEVVNSKAPNLRLSPDKYDKQYFDMLTNQLRLYFTTIDNVNAALLQSTSSASVMNWLGEGSF